MCVPERHNQLKCSPSWPTLLCICDLHKMKLFFPLLHICDLHKMKLFFPFTSCFWPTQDGTFSPLLHISDLHKMELFSCYFMFLTHVKWNIFPITSCFWPTQDETFFLLLHISDLHKMKLFPRYFMFLTYTRCSFFPLLSPVCSPLPVPWTVFGFCWCIILQRWLIILFDFVLGYLFWRRGGLWFACWGIACAPFLTNGFRAASHWCSHQLWSTCLEACVEGTEEVEGQA